MEAPSTPRCDPIDVSELCLRLAQGIRSLPQLARSFYDTSFELLIELVELGLGSLERGAVSRTSQRPCRLARTNWWVRTIRHCCAESDFWIGALEASYSERKRCTS